jgi:hypothetical protein
MKKLIAMIAMVSVLIASSGCASAPKTGSEVQAKDLKVSEKTSMHAVLDVPMEESNMLYCVTFQLAWNELMDNVLKGEIILESEKELSGKLNQKKQTKGSLSPDDYIAMVGMGRDDIVKKINDEMDRKFNEEDKWKVESEVGPDDYLAFAFLKKVLEFGTSFEKVEEGLDFKGTKVSSFGIMTVKDPEVREKLAMQVELLYYKNDKEFIIRLKDKEAKEELYLAMLPEEETLEKMVDKARSLEGQAMKLGPSDVLNIPVIAFDIKHNYKELENQAVMNKGFEGYSIGSALQRIEFVLNESGAVLKSKAEITMVTSMPMDPKSLIFDDSFLLYMTEAGQSDPYLVVYVDNAEILTAK